MNIKIKFSGKIGSCCSSDEVSLGGPHTEDLVWLSAGGSV